MRLTSKLEELNDAATIRRARLSVAASVLASCEVEMCSDRERLDSYTTRLGRLLVGQYELLRIWVEDETAARQLKKD